MPRYIRRIDYECSVVNQPVTVAILTGAQAGLPPTGTFKPFHIIDLLYAGNNLETARVRGPHLDLVEIPIVRVERVRSFFVGPA